ncbi:MAG: phage antirepressor N-terminal domain-containing protein [Cyclobacteriaceae bacterium]
MKQELKKVSVVNGQSILMIDDEVRLVPIKPICDALGIAANKQVEKIKNDVLLNSTATLRVSVANDGKEREMFCLPLKYIFGWLFTINPSNVKEESRAAVLQYRSECYDVLYSHFSAKSDYVKSIHQETSVIMDLMDQAKEQFSKAKKHLDLCKERYKKVRSITFEDWKDANGQMELFFANQTTE